MSGFADSQAGPELRCRCAGCGEPFEHIPHSRGACWHQACLYPRREPPVHPEPDHPGAIEIDVGPDIEGNPQVFRLPWQDGPVRDVGKNGAQADEVLEQTREYLRAFLPPAENGEPLTYGEDCTATAVFHIQMAVEALKRRTRDRERRGVEGTAQA